MSGGIRSSNPSKPSPTIAPSLARMTMPAQTTASLKKPKARYQGSSSMLSPVRAA